RQLIRNWSPAGQRISSFIYWSIPVISLLLFFAAFFWLNEKLSPKSRNFLISFVFILYVSKIFSAIALLFADLVRLGQWSWKSVSELFNGPEKQSLQPDKTPSLDEGISRSEFLTKAALAIGATHVGAMSWGIISGAYDYRIRRVPLKLSNLPRQFHGLKLIQISDIHSRSFYNKKAVQ